MKKQVYRVFVRKLKSGKLKYRTVKCKEGIDVLTALEGAILRKGEIFLNSFEL